MGGPQWRATRANLVLTEQMQEHQLEMPVCVMHDVRNGKQGSAAAAKHQQGNNRRATGRASKASTAAATTATIDTHEMHTCVRIIV